MHEGRAELPVLLSVPHAGRDYPDWLIDSARSGRAALQTLEDPLVDRLVEPAIAAGFGAVIARTPRAAIDCNRSEEDIDPAVIRGSRPGPTSARARGGLGIIPARTVSHGSLWRRPVDRAELEQRIAGAHRPYHEAIDRALKGLLARFGCALLLDCHSMPTPSPRGPQVVIGDRFGRSATRWLTAEALTIARQRGFTASVNEPFAGGHVVERHGDPARGQHALQIEIDRSCYLEPDGRTLSGRAADAAALITALAEGLGGALLGRGLPAAAE